MRPRKIFCSDRIKEMRTAVNTAVEVRKKWDRDWNLNQAF